MKRFIILFSFFALLISFQTTSFAAGTKTGGDSFVSDSYNSKGEARSVAPVGNPTEQASPSLFPSIMKFIFSFILVIVLLFVLLRFLSKRSNLNTANGTIIPIGGHTLGNNRSLQVLLIGQTIYIVGVGDTVSLIRTIEQGDEFQHLLESLGNQTEPASNKWVKDTKKVWDSIFQNQLKNMQKENSEE